MLLGKSCGVSSVRQRGEARIAEGIHGEKVLERWFSDGATGRPYLDLWQANRDQLVASGLSEDAVFVAGLCSKTYGGLMHSYRAEGQKAGRMVGIIKSRAVVSDP